MIVHIGGGVVLGDDRILGIFDLDATTRDFAETGEDSLTRRFLAAAEERDALEIVSPEVPRSFVVTETKVYLTPVSAATLRHRLEHPEEALAAGKEEGSIHG